MVSKPFLSIPISLLWASDSSMKPMILSVIATKLENGVCSHICPQIVAFLATLLWGYKKYYGEHLVDLLERARVSLSMVKYLALDMLDMDLLHAQRANGTHVKQSLTLVFVETKKGVDSLEYWMCSNGLPATTIHGDRTQQEREQALRYFKSGDARVGVAENDYRSRESPEIARHFLLDVATVIFKAQVQIAFREGIARQNAHSIFVCLALSLLEEHVHVACKEITTLEK
eukprot:Gb_10040 [translate_table: standard]